MRPTNLNGTIDVFEPFAVDLWAVTAAACKQFFFLYFFTHLWNFRSCACLLHLRSLVGGFDEDGAVLFNQIFIS